MDGLNLTDNPATNGAKAVLGKKYGSLPLWVWLIIVGGTAYGVRVYLNRRQTAADATDTTAAQQQGTTDASSVVPVGGGAALNTTANTAGSYGGQVDTTSGSTTVSSAYDTNAKWIVGATSVLTGLGTYNGLTVSNALNKYVNGVSLATDPQASAIVSAAIAAVGAPPEGVPVQTPATAATPLASPVASKNTHISITSTGPLPSKKTDTLNITIVWTDQLSQKVKGKGVLIQLNTGSGWFIHASVNNSGSGIFSYTELMAHTIGHQNIRVVPNPNSGLEAVSNVLSYTIK